MGLTISPALSSVSSSEMRQKRRRSLSGEDTKHTAVTLLLDLRFGTLYELLCEISSEVESF